MGLGLAELEISAAVALLAGIPIAVVVWIVLRLRKTQADQTEIRHRLESIEQRKG